MLLFDDVYHLQKIMEAPEGSPRLLGYLEWYGDRKYLIEKPDSDWCYGVYKGRPYVVVVECFDFDGTPFPGLLDDDLFLGRIWDDETTVHLFYSKEWFNDHHPYLVTFDDKGRHRYDDNRKPEIVWYNIQHQFARFFRWIRLGFK